MKISKKFFSLLFTLVAICTIMLSAGLLNQANAADVVDPNHCTHSYNANDICVYCRAVKPNTTHPSGWTQWTSTDSLPTKTGGYYYLANNVTLKSAQIIDYGKQVYLDLNGKTITKPDSTKGLYELDNTSNLFLADSKNTGILKSADFTTNGYAVIWVNNSSATFYMYGGTIQNNCNRNWGGAICVSYGTCYMFGGKTWNTYAYGDKGGGAVYVGDGTFYMYDGAKIQYGNAPTNEKDKGLGGGVYVSKNGDFDMHGGLIDHCTAERYGGGVEVEGGFFTMRGGTISNCKATKYDGGGIDIDDDGTVWLTGGTITGCSAAENGGGVNILDGTLRRFGGTITNNTAPNGATTCTYTGAHQYYAVQYNANGGTGAPSLQYRERNTNLTLSSTKPTRTGYAFNGWNTNASGTGTNYASGGTYKEDIYVTLYAKWTANKYKIAYNMNSGSGSISTGTATYDTAYTLSTTKPTRSGYVFCGWNTKADGTGTLYRSGAQVTNLSSTNNATVTLYARWMATTTSVSTVDALRKAIDDAPIDGTALTIKLTADINGSYSKLSIPYDKVLTIDLNGHSITNTYSSTFAPYRCKITIKNSSATKSTITGSSRGIYLHNDDDGYNGTKAWGKLECHLDGNITVNSIYVAGGTKLYIDSPSIVVNSWVSGEGDDRYWKVNYNANGGPTAPESQYKYRPSNLALPNETYTRTGYTLTGWNTKADGTGTNYGFTYNTNAVTTLYAQWVPKECKFTLNRNCGYGGDSSATAKYDEPMPTINIPERSDYIFNGYWDDNDNRIFKPDGTPCKAKSDFMEDMTLTACWERTLEIADKKIVDESITGAEKTEIEQLTSNLNVTISDSVGKKHLYSMFTQNDTISHDLYYKTVVKSASEDAVSMDIKPMEQAYERGEKVGGENELEVEEGTQLKMYFTLPNSMKNKDRIYLKHVKEDGTTYYEDLQVKHGAVSFVNEHGFSEFDISTEEYGEPEYCGHSLLLGGEIGVNFLMTIPEAYKDGSMKFIVDGRETTANGVYDEKSNSYKFTCYLNAIQMAEEITAVYSCDGYSQIQKYSIADYIEEAKSIGTDRMKNLANKMHSYGYYAQKYLNGLGKINLGDGTDKYSEMTIPAVATDTGVNLSSYEVSISDNGNENITDVKKTLVLDSKVGLNLYLTLSDDATYNEGKKPVVTVDGETLDASKISFETSGNTTMVVKMDSISASKLGHTYKVVVDDSYTINVSAMSYADALMKLDGQEGQEYAKELGAAIYEYYKSVMEYADLDLE